ncbi:MAG TPA: choice-of-anchor tandem repeat NxxGxxAF-containing protein, partial [Phycisphaerales bacterium]|nr:choice-of-anchor tandem repeat NxxGxxAF-containing protein [Phycisphaerales bacterium]
GGPVNSYNDGGLYFGPPDAPRLVIRAGDPAPGIPGMNIELIPGQYALSQSTGKIAFNAFYLVAPQGAVAGQGIWGGDAFNPHLLAKTGDPVPEMPGSHFGEFVTWSVNDAGEVAFASQLDTVQDSVLCVSRADGSLRVVARTGQQVPGMPPGIGYWRVADGAFLDNSGHLAFMAFHNDQSRPPSERRAIFYGPIEDPQLLVFIGQDCPGLASGDTFADLGGPFMSVSGSVMFRGIARGADITPANNFGVWAGGPGDVHLVIRAGDQAPGLPAGVIVNSLSGSFLSSAGRLVVRGQIAGPGIDLIDGNLIPDALWAEDATGALQLVARAGIPMEVEPGNFLTPLGFTLAGERSYAPSQSRQFYNSSGRLLFSVDFIEDGSAALFTADITPVCRADYNGSDGVTVADIFDFLNGWFAGDEQADFNGGGLSVSDIFDFLNAWFAGCA